MTTNLHRSSGKLPVTLVRF